MPGVPLAEARIEYFFFFFVVLPIKKSFRRGKALLSRTTLETTQDARIELRGRLLSVVRGARYSSSIRVCVRLPEVSVVLKYANGKSASPPRHVHKGTF